jgi:cytochrome c553
MQARSPQQLWVRKAAGVSLPAVFAPGRGRAAVFAPVLVALGLLAPVAPAQAGVAEGAQKAQVCVACHGAEGKSTNPMFPVIAGQPRQFLVSALFQFREGKRKNDQMTPFTANLTNTDLNDLAAYFNAQTFPAPARQAPADKVAAGRALTEKNACIACHGATLLGQQHIPRIAGQHMDYLRTQLSAFKATTRGDLDGTMTSAAQALSPQDIEILSDYLSGLAAP